MDQIWYQISMWYQDLVLLSSFTIITSIILSLTLSSIVTVILLILIFLSRCWLLIIPLRLILTWKLLILSYGNIQIWIVRHMGHQKPMLGVGICCHSICFPLLLLCEAPCDLLFIVCGAVVSVIFLDFNPFSTCSPIVTISAKFVEELPIIFL